MERIIFFLRPRHCECGVGRLTILADVYSDAAVFASGSGLTRLANLLLILLVLYFTFLLFDHTNICKLERCFSSRYCISTPLFVPTGLHYVRFTKAESQMSTKLSVCVGGIFCSVLVGMEVELHPQNCHSMPSGYYISRKPRTLQIDLTQERE